MKPKDYLLMLFGGIVGTSIALSLTLRHWGDAWWQVGASIILSFAIGAFVVDRSVCKQVFRESVDTINSILFIGAMKFGKPNRFTMFPYIYFSNGIKFIVSMGIYSSLFYFSPPTNDGSNALLITLYMATSIILTIVVAPLYNVYMEIENKISLDKDDIVLRIYRRYGALAYEIFIFKQSLRLLIRVFTGLLIVSLAFAAAVLILPLWLVNLMRHQKMLYLLVVIATGVISGTIKDSFLWGIFFSVAMAVVVFGVSVIPSLEKGDIYLRLNTYVETILDKVKSKLDILICKSAL